MSQSKSQGCLLRNGLYAEPQLTYYGDRACHKSIRGAPYTGSQDAYSHPGGITLHVDADEQLARKTAPNFCLWSDTTGCSTSNVEDDFISVKDRHFGTPTEYGSANKVNLLTQKHYVYRYLFSIHSYRGAVSAYAWTIIWSGGDWRK